MKCQNCGTNNANEALFCGECGTQLVKNRVSVATQPTAPVEPAATVVEAATIPYAQAYANAAQEAGATFGGGFKEYFHYQRQIEDKMRESRAMNETAFLAKQEYEFLQARWNKCLKLTIVFAILGGILGVYLAVSATSSSSLNGFSIVFMAIMVTVAIAFLGGSIAFGFMPIKDFFCNHSFFLIFNWIILVVAFMLTFYICMFTAIPYAVYLRHKIAAAKCDMEMCQHQAQALEAELASY